MKKKELLKIYKQNDEKIEQELREKYNINNLFKNKQNQETQFKIKVFWLNKKLNARLT